MLSTLTGGGTWTPRRLPGLVTWLNAARNSVVLNATNEVTTWNSSGSDSLSVASTGTDEPDWDPSGWGSGIPAIAMSQLGATALTSTTAGIVNPGSGTDVPFSLFCTVQPTVVADHTIACWQDSVGTSLSSLRMNNSGTGTLRYRRTDAAASSVDVDGTTGLGFFRHRIGVLFAGTTVSIYLNGAVEVTAASSNVGALTPDTFKVGSGPLIDAFTGLVQDVVIMNRLVSVADYLAYYNWSRRAFG